MKMTAGKLAGLKAVSDHRGVIAAAAMDQRGSLQKSLAKERGGDRRRTAISKSSRPLVTEVLTPHASAILLDPEFGLPASKHRATAGPSARLREDRLRRDRPRPPARPARPLVRPPPQGSWRRLHQDPPLLHPVRKVAHINDRKHAFIERIGDECRAHDIPFFLEFVGYDRGWRREVARLREEEARDRLRLHGRVRQGPLRRRRAQGRSPRRNGVRRRHQGLQGRDGLHRAGSPPALPRRRGRGHTSPSSISRPASPTPSSSRPSSWPSNPAPRSTASSAAAPPGRTASRCTPRRAPTRSKTGCNAQGVEEHRQREQPAGSGASVVRVLRRQVGRRAPLSDSPSSSTKGRATRSSGPFIPELRSATCVSGSRRRSPCRDTCRPSRARVSSPA